MMKENATQAPYNDSMMAHTHTPEPNSLVNYSLLQKTTVLTKRRVRNEHISGWSTKEELAMNKNRAK